MHSSSIYNERFWAMNEGSMEVYQNPRIVDNQLTSFLRMFPDERFKFHGLLLNRYCDSQSGNSPQIKNGIGSSLRRKCYQHLTIDLDLF
jgi:hypothetical protein